MSCSANLSPGATAWPRSSRPCPRGSPSSCRALAPIPTKYVSYLDRDNPGVGRIYAEYIGKKLGGKGNVAIMMGLAGNTYAEDVLRGVREGMAKYPGLKEVGLVYGAWSPV